MKVYLANETGAELVLSKLPVPELSATDVRIKTNCIAINPVDWKRIDYAFLVPEWPLNTGCDVSGVVDAVGEEVTRVAVGDAVFLANMDFMTPGTGSYSEYTRVTESIYIAQKPENLSFEDAASLPVSFLTAYVSLFHESGLGLSKDLGPASEAYEDTTVLVWGGSTTVGFYAIQLLNNAGYTVLTTASPKNFELVSSLGAKECFDYRAEDVIQQIGLSTEGRLRYALDTAGSSKISDTLRTDGPALLVNITGQEPGNLLENITFKPFGLPSTPTGEIELAYNDLIYFLADGSIRTVETTVYNGIDSIPEAVKAQKGGVSAKKIVVKF